MGLERLAVLWLVMASCDFDGRTLGLGIGLDGLSTAILIDVMYGR